MRRGQRNLYIVQLLKPVLSICKNLCAIVRSCEAVVFLQLQISFEQFFAIVKVCELQLCAFWSNSEEVLCSCGSLCTVAKQLFFATENQFRTIVCSCEAVKVIGDHSSESNARLATGIPAKTLSHRSPLVTHGSRPMRAQCWASLRSHWSSLTPLPRAVITWLEDTCCVSLWVRIRSRHLASFTTSEPLSKLYQSCLKIVAFTILEPLLVVPKLSQIVGKGKDFAYKTKGKCCRFCQGKAFVFVVLLQKYILSLFLMQRGYSRLPWRISLFSQHNEMYIGCMSPVCWQTTAPSY